MSMSDLSPNHKAIMPVQLKFAAIEQDSPSKVPILLPGDITPFVMCMYENACNRYFDTKDIAVESKSAGSWQASVTPTSKIGSGAP